MSCFLTQVIFVTEDRRWRCRYLYKNKMFTNILNPSIIVYYRRGQSEARMSKRVCEKSCIFIIFGLFLHYRVRPIFSSKFVCSKLKKVENHCSRISKILLVICIIFTVFGDGFFCRLGSKFFNIIFLIFDTSCCCCC